MSYYCIFLYTFFVIFDLLSTNNEDDIYIVEHDLVLLIHQNYVEYELYVCFSANELESLLHTRSLINNNC